MSEVDRGKLYTHKKPGDSIVIDDNIEIRINKITSHFRVEFTIIAPRDSKIEFKKRERPKKVKAE